MINIFMHMWHRNVQKYLPGLLITAMEVCFWFLFSCFVAVLKLAKVLWFLNFACEFWSNFDTKQNNCIILV